MISTDNIDIKDHNVKRKTSLSLHAIIPNNISLTEEDRQKIINKNSEKKVVVIKKKG